MSGGVVPVNARVPSRLDHLFLGLSSRVSVPEPTLVSLVIFPKMPLGKCFGPERVTSVAFPSPARCGAQPGNKDKREAGEGGPEGGQLA